MPRAEDTPIPRTRPATTVVQGVAERRLSRDERLIRGLNVVVATLILVASLPAWIVIAIVVKLTSRGPVFYTQTRVGLDLRRRADRRTGRAGSTRRLDDCGGRPFTIVKFRTMKIDAEAAGQAVWASTCDNRLTLVGGFLRSCRLDELPQLLNVIRGDMNLVGPRPERPQLFTSLREQIPDYQRRQRVRPGITGHAQVHLQYDTSVEDVKLKVQHDLEYIARRSIWEDLRIMLKTIPVMLFRKGGW
ncbi:MAG TPA: sugar transferase [Gemmatimonadales bacterium]|jgi:lipopolysaccharide/colanic/teichoic acid biosynthesis glycosyltransferase